MGSPIKGDKEERAHTAGRGLPATGTLPTQREAVPRNRGLLAGSGAEESHPANPTPGVAGEEVEDHLSTAAPPLPAADSKPRGEEQRAKWSPGRRNIVRGPELWRLLKEQLKDPNRPAF